MQLRLCLIILNDEETEEKSDYIYIRNINERYQFGQFKSS